MLLNIINISTFFLLFFFNITTVQVHFNKIFNQHKASEFAVQKGEKKEEKKHEKKKKNRR